MNRGLIEALDPVTGLRESYVLPRFMNRGLIEASDGAGNLYGKVPTSPIHESGPH